VNHELAALAGEQAGPGFMAPLSGTGIGSKPHEASRAAQASEHTTARVIACLPA
jgi:hypothetical protein